MSLLSKLLNKAVGVPEVNLNKLPFANKIVGVWEKKSMEDLVKQLPKETIVSYFASAFNDTLDEAERKLEDIIYLYETKTSLNQRKIMKHFYRSCCWNSFFAINIKNFASH